jgi:hypothetical protein
MSEKTENRMRLVPGPAAGLALAACLLAGPIIRPAAADWLVTREGGRVETRGAWETKGKLVVFRTADGTLSSIRLSEVDLDASRRLTDEAARQQTQAQQAVAAKPAEKKPSRVVLTDKDFRKAPPPAQPAGETAASEADADNGAAPAEEPAPRPEGLGVAEWERQRDETEGYVVITGTLQNTGGTTAADVQLSVQLTDEAGTVIATGLADLSASALPPGQRTGFRVAFPGIYSFADAKFETASVDLVTGSSASQASTGGN